jgi:hypothetical protein
VLSNYIFQSRDPIYIFPSQDPLGTNKHGDAG